MPTIIPQHKIEDIREATNVVELVQGYVTLKQKGQNHFGLCPFHHEKSPSFSVSDAKQIFHCFGCGAGGNVFTFLMRYEGIDFPEAVRFLAQKAGIELELEESDDDIQPKQNEALFHINEFAAKWYHQILMSEEGAKAREYLHGRGFTPDEIKKYGLGYAPSAWDKLVKHTQQTTNSLEALTNAGLVSQKKEGGYLDRFRDRIMFPILNLSGRVVAFGGRIIVADKKTAKYINTSETSIYEKGKLLYGLFQNRDQIRQQKFAILVEGYMDLLSLASAGIHNVIASSGTSLTEDQARLLKRYTSKTTVLYDSDLAGKTAAARGADILTANGLEASIASLPSGHDPDSYVREFGTDALTKELNAAKSLFDYKLDRLANMSAADQTEGIRSVLSSLAQVKDKIARNILLSKISIQIGISENILWAELEALLNKQVKDSIRLSGIGERLSDLSKVKKHTRLEKAVEDLIRILISDWSTAEFIFNNINFEDISDFSKTKILEYYKNKFKSGAIILDDDDSIAHYFHDVELSEFIVRELNMKKEDLDYRRWAKECLQTIHETKIREQLQLLKEDIKQSTGDKTRIKELLQACTVLEQKRKEFMVHE